MALRELYTRDGQQVVRVSFYLARATFSNHLKLKAKHFISVTIIWDIDKSICIHKRD